MTVEAQSLAAITNLAFNPPARPDLSSQTLSSPLTLYIVRVPGSRDVFLTPWKPRDRVVNAQDVQSSLYFLHVDNPEDHLVSNKDTQPNTQPQEQLRRVVTRKPVSPVVRRPLPTPPASPCENDFELASRFSRDADSWTSVPARKPVVPSRSPKRDSASSLSLQTGGTACHGLASPVDEDTGQKLTLIRRDPSTGEQWNVAKIHDPPVDEVSSTSINETNGTARRIKNSGSPLYLEIHNPSYSAYMAAEERTFKRRLWLDGSKYADHTYSVRHSLSAAVHDRRNKGYAFHDSWGQKCDFTTASTGRALKCRRGSATRPTGEQPPMTASAMDISELRFNLPVHHFRSKSNSADTPASTEVSHKRMSYFSHHPAHSEPAGRATRSSFCEDGSIDYSLGRERAGGGFGGRETKLGKLIVYPGGQDMLDLAVAANMALWW
ncbi:hypothetical protein K461DRAFT_278708, partial [Myriangium duriaei CBS 260.36]